MARWAGGRRQSPARRFHDLTPYRIREILLVSSPYDAFILEEDGQLTEQVFHEYRGLSLSGPPRVNHAASGREALERLRVRRFDLILVMSSLAEMGVNEFGRKVRKMRPNKPIVFLALDQKELDKAREALDTEVIDGTFLWTGDSKILLAIIKFIEDRENVDHDIEKANLRVILVLEDSPRYYSSFLGMLYEELMKQSRSLYSEGVNELQRRMYMRSRPKILHARTYEGGLELLTRYRCNLLALISDVRIPRGGELDAGAGLDFVRHARELLPDLTVLVLSAESENRERADEMGLLFVDKTSETLLGEISDFLRSNLGFGPFVFRAREDGPEVARARDVREFERILETIEPEAIAYHAAHDHFSIWLMARSEFELAETLRPKKIEDFQGIEDLRRYLLEELRDVREAIERGAITDYRRENFDRDLFSRIGGGSMGAKAQGIAFLNHRLADLDPAFFGKLPVVMPKTVVVATEIFDEFIQRDELGAWALEETDDLAIAERFLARPLPSALIGDLRIVVERMRRPLAVRSSSLLEDSMHQPFAGIYATLMIPNAGDDAEQRLQQLAAGIRLVYASTFFQNAKAYRHTTATRADREKMGVIVQTLIGQAHGQRFYPAVAGVAHSYNFYPLGPQRPEDGVVHLALGLGRTVVDGGLALRLSPRHPGVLPQLATPKAMLRSTQRHFFALDLASLGPATAKDLFATVRRYELADAEQDGALAAVGSVLSRDDQRLRDDLSAQGPRIITFNNVLKNRPIGLLESISRLLELAREGLGCEVEVEFACRLGAWGPSFAVGDGPTDPELDALQVRPVAARTMLAEPSRLRFTREETLCASTQCLGHGVETALRDLVYVCRDRWKAAHNKDIAREIGQLNDELGKEERPYILIGPGRWGTSDEWLGIPVAWSQISNVRVMVEASPAGYEVEPSQGTHFFQNITSLQIGYLTVPPGAEKGEAENGGAGKDAAKGAWVDWAWLDAQEPTRKTAHLRHLRFEQPFTVVLDGRHNRGTITRPGARGLAGGEEEEG